MFAWFVDVGVDICCFQCSRTTLRWVRFHCSPPEGVLMTYDLGLSAHAMTQL